MTPAANLEGKLSLNWRLDFPNGFLKDDFILALFCRSLSWKISEVFNHVATYYYKSI